MRARSSTRRPPPPAPPPTTSKAAADKLEQKRAALEDALGKYRDAKDAQKRGRAAIATGSPMR